MKPNSPLVFRLQPELNARLEECAERLRQKKYSLALAAIEAAVDAIEQNDYKLVVPIKFEVTHVAMPKETKPIIRVPGKYPSHREQDVTMHEESSSKKISPERRRDISRKAQEALVEDLKELKESRKAKPSAADAPPGKT